VNLLLKQNSTAAYTTRPITTTSLLRGLLIKRILRTHGHVVESTIGGVFNVEVREGEYDLVSFFHGDLPETVGARWISVRIISGRYHSRTWRIQATAACTDIIIPFDILTSLLTTYLLLLLLLVSCIFAFMCIYISFHFVSISFYFIFFSLFTFLIINNS